MQSGDYARWVDDERIIVKGMQYEAAFPAGPGGGWQAMSDLHGLVLRRLGACGPQCGWWWHESPVAPYLLFLLPGGLYVRYQHLGL